MNSQSDRLRELLRRRMAKSDLTINGWAKQAGMPESTLRNFLAGRSDTLTYSTLSSLAGAANISTSDLIRNDETTVRVLHRIDADEWIAPFYASQIERSENWRFSINVPVDPRFKKIDRFGVQLVDSSFDAIYLPGTVAICTSFYYFHRGPKPGDKVFCEETPPHRPGVAKPGAIMSIEEWKEGYRVRYSIREVFREGDDVWLVHRARSPRWKDPIEVPIVANPPGAPRAERLQIPRIFKNPKTQTLVQIRGLIIAVYQIVE